MGQYHKIMNFDKKEMCEPPSLRKLMEWSYQGNEYLCAIEHLLMNEWKGDRVLVVGDYVSDAYDNLYFSELFDKIREENKDYNINNIYDYPYKKVNNCRDAKPIRYIYNHATKEYFDIKNQPIQWGGYIKETNTLYGTKIHPLSLILTCSNGLGGGDYYADNADKIGMWAYNSCDLELSDKKLDNDYKEVKIAFDEYKLNKSNKQLLMEYLYEAFDKDSLDQLDKVKFSSNLLLSEAEKNKIKQEVKDLIITLSKDEVENDDIEIDK